VTASATDLWALRYPKSHALRMLVRAVGGPTGERHVDAASRAGRVRVARPRSPTQALVIFASEQMDQDDGWRMLESDELVHVDVHLPATSRGGPLPATRPHAAPRGSRPGRPLATRRCATKSDLLGGLRAVRLRWRRCGVNIDRAVSQGDRSAMAIGALARSPTVSTYRDEATVRVLIAADVRLYRESLAEILGRDERIDVVGVTGDPVDMLSLVGELKPDVALLDPAVPGSMAAVRELAKRALGVKVVALAAQETEAEVIECAEAGVSGFVTRDQSLADLVASIRSAARGDLVCSPETAGTLLRRVRALAAAQPRLYSEAHLTQRELEVVRLLQEGLSNKQIAHRLCIELPTVKHHVHHILEKLGVGRRGEAVARLRHGGLIQAVPLLDVLDSLPF
jgi:two-component system nitrate/nitrite response regulator NarL